MIVVKAPWDAYQVFCLNQYQRGKRGFGHEYTCIHGHVLIATLDGWVCGSCVYTQDWAHEGSFYAG